MADSDYSPHIMMHSKPIIILVRPQMGENIGAAARIMLNFGLSELRLVAPRDGWPNAKAIEMAVSAAPVLENAKVFDEFTDAVADIEYLAMTTARMRDMEKPVKTPQELCENLNPNLKTAIVFGPERTGLHNEEVALGDCIINIPVSKEFQSINLAQSVAIVAYELSKRDLSLEKWQLNEPATKQELIDLVKHAESELDDTGFFTVEKKRPGMIKNMVNMMAKANLTSQEVRTLRGVIRSLTGKTKQRG